MSARRHLLPRTDSTAHIALTALHTLEGQASDERWRAAAARGLGTKSRRDQWAVTVQSLIDKSLVFKRRGVFIVSDDGLEFLGVVVAAVPRAESLAVPARYIPPMRALSRRFMPSLNLARDGSLDYRAIPSRMGDVLIPYSKA